MSTQLTAADWPPWTYRGCGRQLYNGRPMDLAFPEYGSLTATWSLLLASMLGFNSDLERDSQLELTGSSFTVVRTYPSIAVFGAIIGQLTASHGAVVLVIGFVSVTVKAALTNWRESAGVKGVWTTD